MNTIGLKQICDPLDTLLIFCSVAAVTNLVTGAIMVMIKQKNAD